MRARSWLVVRCIGGPEEGHGVKMVGGRAGMGRRSWQERWKQLRSLGESLLKIPMNFPPVEHGTC